MKINYWICTFFIAVMFAITLSILMATMVLILDVNSEHIAYMWREIGLFEKHKIYINTYKNIDIWKLNNFVKLYIYINIFYP